MDQTEVEARINSLFPIICTKNEYHTSGFRELLKNALVTETGTGSEKEAYLITQITTLDAMYGETIEEEDGG